jgi:ectoine hydroxylase-related dioxygenase (phytanoyl-CoA dioxygenase family)
MTQAATPDAPATAPATTGPTAAERFTFDTQGYLVLENFLKPDHIARLLGALDRAVERRRHKVTVDPLEKRNTLINGAKSTRLLYILEDDPLFQELVDWPAIMPYVHALINPKPHYHASDAIVEDGSELLSRTGGWHIDGNDQGYRGFGWPIPLLQLKVGYYLTDMTQPGNANLTVVPGSHKARNIPSLAELEAQHEWPGAVQVCAPAGTAILFHNALFHAAAPYASAKHRRTMLYYAYEHPWMIGALGHWNYSKDFYNRALTPAQRKLFHGFVFDPPEQRWG